MRPPFELGFFRFAKLVAWFRSAKIDALCAHRDPREFVQSARTDDYQGMLSNVMIQELPIELAKPS